LFDGLRPVPNETEEWRAATSRPRAWGEIVDLAAHRSRPPMIEQPVAAITGPIAEAAPAAIAATAQLPLPIAGPPVPAPRIDQATPRAAASRRRVVRWRRRPAVNVSAVDGSATGRSSATGRRARHAAADLLHRAASWLRESEAEGGL
jgi:hypothetical protein